MLTIFRITAGIITIRSATEHVAEIFPDFSPSRVRKKFARPVCTPARCSQNVALLGLRGKLSVANRASGSSKSGPHRMPQQVPIQASTEDTSGQTAFRKFSPSGLRAIAPPRKADMNSNPKGPSFGCKQTALRFPDRDQRHFFFPSVNPQRPSDEPLFATSKLQY